MKRVYKLSPSALSLMEDCPRCFWLRQNDRWERPAGIFPSLPSGMDSILKRHFDNFMRRKLLPPELAERKECKGLLLFTDEAKLNEWRNNRKGISHTDSRGNVLHGAVDNLLTKGDKLVVLDYKTRGFPLKEDTASKYQHQLDVYNYLLRKNGLRTEDFGFLLFYMPREVLSGGEVLFDTTLVKMKIDTARAERLWKKALLLLSGPCPKKHCEWCELVPD